MTLDKCKEVRNIIEKELEPILKKHGYRVNQGNVSYQDEYMKFGNFRVMPLDALDEDQALLIKYKTDILDLDKTVVNNGRTLKLHGYKPNRPKYPYVLKDINSKDKYKFPSDWVDERFSLHKAEGGIQWLKKGNKFHNGSVYENVIIEAGLAKKQTIDNVDYLDKNVNRKEINEHLLDWEEAGAFNGWLW